MYPFSFHLKKKPTGDITCLQNSQITDWVHLCVFILDPLLLAYRVMSKMSFLMKAGKKEQCHYVMSRDCDRERSHRYRSNVTNNTWGSIMGSLWRERQHLRDSGQVEFSPSLGDNYASWPNMSWCFTLFDIIDHFKHLTLKWQCCCSCSCMVLPNKLRL